MRNLELAANLIRCASVLYSLGLSRVFAFVTPFGDISHHWIWLRVADTFNKIQAFTDMHSAKKYVMLFQIQDAQSLSGGALRDICFVMLPKDMDPFAKNCLLALEGHRSDYL